MSLKPLTVPNGLLIFKNLHFTGFWVNKWYDQATARERADTFAHIFDLARRGLLRTRIERTYPLTDFREAVARASESERSGKVLFSFA
jgi:trans-2-enoyl-CoA reductase